MAKYTVMVWLLGLESLTVKVKGVVRGGVLLGVPSGVPTSSMESTAVASSFWIVTVPTALTIVALVAPDSVSVEVSAIPNAVVTRAHTGARLLVSPGAKVSVVLLWLM